VYYEEYVYISLTVSNADFWLSMTDAVCSKPVHVARSADEYLVTTLKHRKTFTVPGLSAFLWLVNLIFKA